MKRTLLCSNTSEVAIGPDQPFVIIGERINPTGRNVLAAEFAEGNYARAERDALAQIQAGAHVLDINAGVPTGDEAKIMGELVTLVQTLTDVPLCIDSSVVAALESGLAAYRGKALVNSVTGEERRLERVLPLVKKHDAAVVAICNDENGISPDPEVRFAVAKKILERARDYGIDPSDVVVDPLVMPVGADNDAGRTALRVVARVHQELGLNTVCGASNVSFGLPARPDLNATFLAMLIGAGLTSAILNPLPAQMRTSIAASETLAGIDRKCKRWIKRCRALTENREPEERVVTDR